MSHDARYNSKAHREWSAAVIRNAGGLCQECRRYGRTDKDGNPVRAVLAHHIVPRKVAPEKAYDLGNGQALCWACHNKKHPEKGGKRWRF